MNTRPVKVGELIIGGGFPVRIQTMWKDPLPDDFFPLIRELHSLAEIGCELVRFSVPDKRSAEILCKLAAASPVPVSADIHFDHTLAIACIRGGVHKIRINPGNIGASWKVEEVIRAASEHEVPVRVGVNGGSLPRSLRNFPDKAQAMVKAAEEELEILEKLDFKNVIFSLKASDIDTTVKANEIFSRLYRYPLHLGVTEAGPLIPGIVKSTIALGQLLKQGIGDTIRISLSDSPANEVLTAREILKAYGLSEKGIKIVSCPRCGRSSFDTHWFLEKISGKLNTCKKSLTIAVMGCVVNGPGEAGKADLGITGAGNEVIIFKKGTILRKVALQDAVEIFLKELSLCEDSNDT